MTDLDETPPCPPTDGVLDNPNLRLAGSLGFYANRLVVTDPGLIGKLDRPTWSPSGAQAMSSCPSRWAVERLIETEPDPFGAAPLGTAAHYVFELLYGLPAEERTLERAVGFINDLDTLHSKHVDHPTDTAELIRWRAEVLARVAPLWDIEDPTQVEVTGTERRLSAVVDGVPFFGIIDRTDATAAGPRVVDYKTGALSSDWKRKKADSHGDQLRLYALALEAADGVRPAETQINYTAYGQTYVPTLDTRSLNRVRQQFVATWNEMKASAQSGEYRTAASPLCGWCPLATVCPTASSAGKGVAKVDAANLGELLGIRVLTDDEVSARRGSRTTTPHTVNPAASTEQEHTMSAPIVVEDKSWEEASADGRLNANSYAAMAAFGLVSMAVEQLHKAGQPLTKTTVQSLSATFAHLVNTVQADLGQSGSLMDGLNTRLRGALHTTLATLPVPFGQPLDEWDEWVTLVTNRMTAIARTAINLWSRGPGERPWEALTETTSEPVERAA